MAPRTARSALAPLSTGRVLISIAAAATGVAPVIADWNRSHIFSDQWSPHARFHGIVSLGMAILLSPLALWLAWRRTPDEHAAVTAAAMIPIAYRSPFLVAPLVPGAGVDDPGHRLPRLAGRLPPNLLAAAVTASTAALGWLLERRGRPT